MKFISSVLCGLIIGGFTVYFGLKWEDEDLRYIITPPAQFGEIIYHNIHIANGGWNPAENVKLYIDSPEIKFENVRTTAHIKQLNSEKNGILIIDRIRKNEVINLSIAYTGNPINENEIKFLSDRSVATFTERKHEVPSWLNTVTSIALTLYIIMAIAEGLYPFLKMKEKEAEEKERQKAQKQ